jgi:hypothetical protein
MKATYVSVWDNGDETIYASCEFNPETKEATDIEQVDVEELDLNYLDEEYVELPNGERITTFTTDCGRKVIDGQLDESLED